MAASHSQVEACGWCFPGLCQRRCRIEALWENRVSVSWQMSKVSHGDHSMHRSDQISRSVMSDSLWPHELQHARPPCPSPTPRVHPDSHPSSQWCHPAISSSVVPFSSKTIRINGSSKVSVYTDSVYKCHFYFSLLAMNTSKTKFRNNKIFFHWRMDKFSMV